MLTVHPAVFPCICVVFIDTQTAKKWTKKKKKLVKCMCKGKGVVISQLLNNVPIGTEMRSKIYSAIDQMPHIQKMFWYRRQHCDGCEQECGRESDSVWY